MLTAGSFDGQHVYPHGGVYTVSVTLADDDGGVATGSFLVFVGPTLNVATNQTVDEGSLLTITGIGQFTDPTPQRLDPGGPNNAPYTYSINWGDGRGIDSGLTTNDAVPLNGAATSGSFNGSHTFADNGVYTVTVTVMAGDGRADVSTLSVTVNNVAPTSAPISDHDHRPDPAAVDPQHRPVHRPRLQQSAQPRRPNRRVVHLRDQLGGRQQGRSPAPPPSTPSAARACSRPARSTECTRFSNSGDMTVTVTVRDDDGGFATQTFVVTVAAIVPKNLIYITGVGAGPPMTTRPVVLEAAVRPVAPQTTGRIEEVSFRSGSVAGAESRLVLRIVQPSGKEDPDADEPLANEVLDGLRKLFSRLPDGHYRIYQIHPDGEERLVVDVIVRQGRSIDAADEAEDNGDAPIKDIQPPAAPAVPPPLTPTAESTTPGPGLDDHSEQAWNAAAVGLGGYMVYAAPGRGKPRLRRQKGRFDDRSLTKVRRMLRRVR